MKTCNRPRRRKQRKQPGGLMAAAIILVILTVGLFTWRDTLSRLRLGPLTETEQQVKQHAQENGTSLTAYPRSLTELLEHNPETKEFVMNYPFRKQQEISLKGYDRTAGVPLFLQWDPQWGYEQYGSDMIAITGCGPTCLAMAGYYLTGDTFFDPLQVAEFSENRGYYIRGKGTAWALISEGGPMLGLQVRELPLWEQTIAAELQQNHPVICIMGPGDFTDSGHFIVLTGYKDGKFSLNDPNSRKNSSRLWSYQQLEPQIQNLWAIQ